MLVKTSIDLTEFRILKVIIMQLWLSPPLALLPSLHLELLLVRQALLPHQVMILHSFINSSELPIRRLFLRCPIPRLDLINFASGWCSWCVFIDELA